MSKNLLQIFHRYTPSDRFAQILLSADAEGIRLRADKDQRLIEVEAPFPQVIPKRTLYEIEEEIRKVYELNVVRILPRYPSSLFGVAQIPDLLMETNRCGIVARGFFNHCSYELCEDSLRIEIPFNEGGVDLIYDAKTPGLMEKIVEDEFGVRIRVSIVRMEGESFYNYEASMRASVEAMEREAAVVQKSYVASLAAEQAGGNRGEVVEETPLLPRASSIYEGDLAYEITEGRCRIGFSAYDISSPEYVYGKEFEIRPVPISTIDKPQKNLIIIGEVFGFKMEEGRGGDKFDVTFNVFDGNASIEHRSFGMETEDGRLVMVYDLNRREVRFCELEIGE